MMLLGLEGPLVLSIKYQPFFALAEIDRKTQDSQRIKRNVDEKIPICQDMDGILGGKNTFHFITFVISILTLIVNLSNNVNNNNNNLNQYNLNINDNSNTNSNVNNNNANVVNVMPPGRKRRNIRRCRIPYFCNAQASASWPIGPGKDTASRVHEEESVVWSKHNDVRKGY